MHASMLLCALLAGTIPGIRAQGDQMFQWGFTGTQAVSTSLPSCRSFPIEASALTAHGVPPYYMMAFAVGGAPITTFIGKNENNLSWTPNHPVGTQLLLGVVDSRGNSGGIDKPLYTVVAGASTQCIFTPAVEPAFTVTANVTDALTTCQPWGLTIQGGTPPYNITLAALNAPDATNVTLGPDDSVFTYINRADPGTQLLASVSDLNGRWATGSPLVRTQGSTNVSCVGLVSIGTQGPPSTPVPSMSRARIGTIAGASAGGLLLVCGLIVWALQRRRRLRRSHDGVKCTPFRTFPSDDSQIGMNPREYLPAVHKSKIVAQARSHHTVPFLMTELRPSSASSPASLPRVRELPPPYAHPGLYEGGL
ncbi:hypothetical protein B0H17DRAFT_1042771 [Mycena rosella]|uniref:Uncharacterized protein n=1 Tax=Mycena rosella TaxID=1033263 RepID=A0AAD7DZS1_MYCRO|nr:hypothetical protein B0H17DRAFT_1042771 [Mycena rosella]